MQAEFLSLIRLDLLFESISGIIALIVTIYATKAYNLTGQKKLSDLSTGFLVLSVGMFGRVVGTWYFIIRYGLEGDSGDLVISIVTIAYGASRIMAYVLFLIATRPARYREPMNGNSMAGMSFLLATILVDSSLEVIAILVLVAVVIQAIINYSSTRSRYALYVFVGFFFILLSHVQVAQTLSNPGMYLMSQLSQLIGFLSFLVLLYRTGKQNE
ncbi:MAG: hypothetical protein ACFFDQ_02750 [Candidatus Thorarchaeota archaeon]